MKRKKNMAIGLVYEWIQDGVLCRLFGTFTEEELENIAESVKVYKNE